MKLHCCLFPSDYEFDRDTLVQLWMAAGFLRKGRMEDVGSRFFDILLAEEFVLPSGFDYSTRKSKYTVNLSKVTGLFNRTLTIKDENPGADCSKSWHVSLTPGYINQATFETTLKRFFSELRTLLFIPNYGSSLRQLPSAMFLAMGSMQTLDLSGSHIIELPNSIGNLTQLHYLNLSFTAIERFPETIDRLTQLQTLRLKGCKKLYALPKGMKELIRLRHLDFDVLGQLSHMPRGIGALTELRTLSAFIVDSEEGGSNIRELKNMNNLSGSCCISGLENISGFSTALEAALEDKKHLTRLQLRWDDSELYSTSYRSDVCYLMAGLRPNLCLEELQLLHYPGSQFPLWISYRQFQKLASITLLKCENNKLGQNLGELPNLRYMNIIEMNEVTQIDSSFLGRFRSVGFPKLEKLVIDGMLSLESWTGVESGDFQLLSELKIKHCPNLTHIPFLPFLSSLKHLEIVNCDLLGSLPEGGLSTSVGTLIIDDCPLLQLRCSKRGLDWHKIEHVPDISIDQKDVHSTHEDGVDHNNSTSDSLSDDDMVSQQTVDEGTSRGRLSRCAIL